MDAVRGPSVPVKGLIARHPLVCFFILAYAGTWLVELPYVRLADGTGLLPFDWPIPFPVSAAVAPYAGPFLAAFIVAAATEGDAGLQDLYRQIVRWRVPARWYLFAIVGIPAIVVLGAIVLQGVPASFQLPAPSTVLIYPVSFFISFLIGGPLGEEPGWRGFALSRLQAQYGSLLGSLILAPLHVLWHLPLFWVPEWGTPRESALDLAWYLLSGVALTFIYTWLYNVTKRSVLITALAHTSVDAFFLNQLFLAPVANSLLPFVIGFGAAAILLIVFTRGQLGYEPKHDSG